MARKGLKNVVRAACTRHGQQTWELFSSDGTRIPAFDAFCAKNSAYVLRTQKRYAEVVARFIDYLIEARVFSESVTSAHLNDVLEAYPTLLAEGSHALAKRVRKSDRDTWLAEVAESLDWAPIRPKSFDSVIPAINRFLRLSESLAQEAVEKAQVLGLAAPKTGFKALIRAIDGIDTISRQEVMAMKQNSMFGNVAKYAPHGLQRPRHLRRPAGTGRSTTRPLDFPREALPSLIAVAETWRDKSMWLMLATVGIRISEARNLLLEDVDMEHQRVYVFDPNGRRAQLGEHDPNRLRFKGRTMAYTYAIPELRRDLFYALTQYLNREFVPCYRPGEPAYLFQYVESSRRGQPLVDASDAALAQSFKRAVKAANVPVPHGGKDWVLHSLRHMYGVFMVNDIPVNPARGEFGLPLVDVQMMMGHKSINSTAHYARSKQRRLEAKLAASDQALLGLTPEELKTLPSFNVRLLGGSND